MSRDSGRFDEPPADEFYCWAAPTVDGTPRVEWYVRNAALDVAGRERAASDTAVVAGPFDIDAAIREAMRRNQEIGLA